MAGIKEATKEALRILKSEESLRDNLYHATVEISIIHPNEIPEPLKECYNYFMKKMTAASAKGGEGKIKATIATMSDKEVEEMAIDIGALCNALFEHLKTTHST